MENLEELKKETINLLLKKKGKGGLLSPRRKDEIIRWVKTGNKPKKEDQGFRPFYVGYGQIRSANKIYENLKKLNLIK